jgi:argininosuccinate lyase
VSQEWELDNFKLHQSDEDIHTAIERRLKVKKGKCEMNNDTYQQTYILL